MQISIIARVKSNGTSLEKELNRGDNSIFIFKMWSLALKEKSNEIAFFVDDVDWCYCLIWIEFPTTSVFKLDVQKKKNSSR